MSGEYYSNIRKYKNIRLFIEPRRAAERGQNNSSNVRPTQYNNGFNIVHF